MDKVTKIQKLLKEKDNRIMQLEQGLENEKQSIYQKWQGQLIEIQNNFNALKV